MTTRQPYMTQGVSQRTVPQPIPHRYSQHLSLNNCNYLEQLQGSYEMETFGVTQHINVLLSTTENKDFNNKGFAIVRRVSEYREPLSDLIILEEQNHFIMCTRRRKIQASTAKGKDMRNGIVWTSTENGVVFVWKRTDLSTANQTWHGLSCTSLSSGLSMLSVNDTTPSHFVTDSSSSQEDGDTAILKMDWEENLFDMIKTYFSGRPSLLKKVVLWGLSKDKNPSIPVKMNPKRIRKLASGRMWVSVMLADAPPMPAISRNVTPEQDAVDNLKGAYQEDIFGSCIYMQPKPEASQPGIQHRLRKENDFWLIEEYDSAVKSWKLRAQELPGRYWLDLKNIRKPLRVKLIPFTNILARMSDHLFDKDVEKQLDFLFRDCNQKKLNTKLKKRNLKHNVQNLKIKLEKQHCLSFAVRVVNIADSIFREHGIHG